MSALPQVTYEVVLKDEVDLITSPTLPMQGATGKLPMQTMQEEMTELVRNLNWLADRNVIKEFEITISITGGSE